MKNKIKKVLVLILLIVVALFSFGGCKACEREQWQHVYDAYVNMKDRFTYQTYNVTVKDVDSFITFKDKSFCILIEEKDYPEIYDGYRKAYYYFVDTSIKVLEETGFYDDIKTDTVIKFTVNDYIGWDGWDYPVFAVEMNGKTYLDFETGYENIINYVKARIKNP